MLHGIISRLVHIQASREKPHIPFDQHAWPEAWTRSTMKEYGRFDRIELPEAQNPTGEIGDLLRNRHSKRDFKKIRSLTIADLSTLLRYGPGLNEHSVNTHTPKTHRTTRRHYPSGGSRYPIETYVVIQEPVESLGPGAYHYNIKHHTLETLVDEKAFPAFGSIHSYPWAKKAPVTIVLSAIWERTFVKYDDFGYRIALLEAGHLSQNIQLVSHALGLVYCPLVGFKTQLANELLDLDEEYETVFYATVIGT